MPLALYALAAGAFGIGTTEFVITGLVLEVSRDLVVSVAAGMLISDYALGVVIGGPILTVLTANLNRKHVLLGLMGIFIIGNAAGALAPIYDLLMASRILTTLAIMVALIAFTLKRRRDLFPNSSHQTVC